MPENDLNKIIDEILLEVEEDEEDELEEMSVTGMVAGYDTPKAFTGGKSKFNKKRKKTATNSTGYMIAKKKKKPVFYGAKHKKTKALGENMKHSEIMKEIYGLNYPSFKGDDTKNSKQKVNGAIKEINRKLFEIDRIIGRATKLKKEDGVSSDGYWKSTRPRMTKIAERLIKVSQKLRELAG